MSKIDNIQPKSDNSHAIYFSIDEIIVELTKYLLQKWSDK